MGLTKLNDVPKHPLLIALNPFLVLVRQVWRFSTMFSFVWNWLNFKWATHYRLIFVFYSAQRTVYNWCSITLYVYVCVYGIYSVVKIGFYLQSLYHTGKGSYCQTNWAINHISKRTNNWNECSVQHFTFDFVKCWTLIRFSFCFLHVVLNTLLLIQLHTTNTFVCCDSTWCVDLRSSEMWIFVCTTLWWWIQNWLKCSMIMNPKAFTPIACEP